MILFGQTSNQIRVVWTSGITAGGSSGSPLLSSSTNRIIGQLRGGGSYCWAQSTPDYYGRVELSYSNGLKEGLVGASSSVTAMDGSYTVGGGDNGGNGAPCTQESDLPTLFTCFTSNSCGGNAGSCWCDSM